MIKYSKLFVRKGGSQIKLLAIYTEYNTGDFYVVGGIFEKPY